MGFVRVEVLVEARSSPSELEPVFGDFFMVPSPERGHTFLTHWVAI